MVFRNSHSVGWKHILFPCLFVPFFVVCVCVDVHGQKRFQIKWEKNSLLIDLSDVQWAAVIKSKDKNRLKDRLSVSLADDAKIQILGKSSFDIEKHQFKFTPRFPIDAGTKLQIEVSSVLEADFVIPGGSRKTKSIVTKIYPSSDRLPANLLKFYIHFSAPMQKGNIYRHFSIFDMTNKKEVELPFLELQEELWSRDGKRLTLFFDPGRIKRGLKPRQDLGPVFVPEKTYQFRISGKWKDENGVPLGKTMVKTFRTMKEDHAPPAYKTWKLAVRDQAQNNKLVIQFDEPMDSALCQRVIHVQAHGKPMKVVAKTLDNREQELILVSEKPIPKGKLVVHIGSELEDLCGNRIGKPFDFDPKRDKPANESKSFQLEFEIR